MRNHLLSSMILALLALFLLAAREGASAPDSSAVLIELFTSQGCSSCPPADRLLSRLAGDPAFRGRVVPLSFHVDYWNHIGWTDPFSAKRWSERQRAYARAFGSGRIYTPQLVVGGESDAVGSDEKKIRGQLYQILQKEPAGTLSVAVEPSGDRLKVKAGATLNRAVEDLELWVAVFETDLTTKVDAGENAAQTLHNDYVVRRLEKVLTLSGKAGATDSGEVVLGIDKRWKRENLGVAAFLQDSLTMAVHGAAAKRLAS